MVLSGVQTALSMGIPAPTKIASWLHCCFVVAIPSIKGNPAPPFLETGSYVSGFDLEQLLLLPPPPQELRLHAFASMADKVEPKALFMHATHSALDAVCLATAGLTPPTCPLQAAALHELGISCTPTLALCCCHTHQPLALLTPTCTTASTVESWKGKFSSLQKATDPIALLPLSIPSSQTQLYLAALPPAPGCLPSQCHFLPQLKSAPFLLPRQDGCHCFHPGKVQRSGY